MAEKQPIQDEEDDNVIDRWVTKPLVKGLKAVKYGIFGPTKSDDYAAGGKVSQLKKANGIAQRGHSRGRIV